LADNATLKRREKKERMWNNLTWKPQPRKSIPTRTQENNIPKLRGDKIRRKLGPHSYHSHQLNSAHSRDAATILVPGSRSPSTPRRRRRAPSPPPCSSSTTRRPPALPSSPRRPANADSSASPRLPLACPPRRRARAVPPPLPSPQTASWCVTGH
jgi:hypothetical protein